MDLVDQALVQRLLELGQDPTGVVRQRPSRRGEPDQASPPSARVVLDDEQVQLHQAGDQLGRGLTAGAEAPRQACGGPPVVRQVGEDRRLRRGQGRPSVGGEPVPPLLVEPPARVRRLVPVSGAGTTVDGDRKGIGARLVSGLTRTLARDLVGDNRAEHEVLRSSSLLWTEVRPPRLTDGTATGTWELTDRAPELRAAAVPRAEVAAAMLHLARSGDRAGSSPFVVRRTR